MEAGIGQYIDLLERYYAEGVTDGLPVVPPVRALVDQAVAAAGRAADEVVGAIPPRGALVTVEDIAVNAVMAGCRPEYLPVVLAAVEAMLADSFNLFHLVTSTKGCAPLLVVNGPIRQALGINARGNIFGPGHRANATIGRAIRLSIINLGGAVSQVVDRATHGHPGKYTYCIAEDEADSPWEPYHVARGYARDQSTVFVQACEGPKAVNVPTSDRAEAILDCLADMACPLGSYTFTGATELVVILGKEHREAVARAGYTRRMVQEYIHARAARRAGELRRVDSVFPQVTAAASDDEPVPLVRSPDHVHVFAAGGPGRMSSVVNGFVSVDLGVSSMRAIGFST